MTWVYFYLCNKSKHFFCPFDIYFILLYMYRFEVGMCTWIPVHVMASYVRSSGIIGICGPPNMSAGNQTLVH